MAMDQSSVNRGWVNQSKLAVFGLLLNLLPVLFGLGQEAPTGIPIELKLQQGGQVTLVIEDDEGRRVRNLISQDPMPAGRHTVWWDGLDDRGRDPDAARHSVFHIPGRIVEPGQYTVRGLIHPEIDLVYRMTPYTNGKPPWRTKDHASEWLTNHSAPSDVIFLPSGVGPLRDGKPTSEGGQIVVCSRVAEGGSGLAWLDMNGDKRWGQHWLGGVWTAASHLAVDRGRRPVPGVYGYAAASWPGDYYSDYKSELRLHKLVDASHRGQIPRDRRFGTGEDRPVVTPFHQLPLLPDAPEIDSSVEHDRKAYYKKYSPELSGLAVHNGIVVSAFAKLNELVFIDAHASRVLGVAEVPDPRGMDFDRSGNLYVLSQTSVFRYRMDPETPYVLAAPETVITGLQDPRYLCVMDNGKLLVSDWGDSHQVLQFAPNGELLFALGDPGAPRIGRYNPNHMNHPAGMALDDRGRLWVTENTHTPKRVSVWDLESRALVDAFYGPMRYGGSGAIDPGDATRFFYDDDHGGTIVFRLDYDSGKSVPEAIPYLDRYNETGLLGHYTGGAPSYPLYHREKLYLTDAYSLHTTGRRTAALWRYDEDNIARIVAAAGNVLDSAGEMLPVFERSEIQAEMPADFRAGTGKSLLYVWSDTDADQGMDPGEVQFLDPRAYADSGNSNPRTGSVTVTEDLSFTFSRVGDVVLQLAPTVVSEAGVPRYDLTRKRILARGAQAPASSGGNQVVPAKDGWLVTTTPVKPLSREGVGGVRHGKPMWSYPSLWPGLHASHIAPVPENPGQLIGTTRLIGTLIEAPQPSDAGELWAINGNKGTVYVFTTDGLFVARLFEDSRLATWDAPEATPGMIVNELSLHEECFGPTWTATNDGRVFLQAYFTGNIIEVMNLDQIRRLPNQTIQVSREQLLAASQAGIAAETRRRNAAEQKRESLTVPLRKTVLEVDGNADDWTDAQWLRIDTRKAQVGNWGKRDIETRASASVGDGRLHLVWQTYDKHLLNNSGESLINLFKNGGCLDVQIGTDPTADPARLEAVGGDQRILITRVKGETVAMLYAPVSPGHSGPGAEFGSPLRTLKFDRVLEVSDRIELAEQSVKDLEADKNGSIVRTTFEVSIPLELLAFEPRNGASYKFDIGVLRGNGLQTLQRVYWSNHAAGIVSDIPSEAELIPALWGEMTVRFEEKEEQPNIVVILCDDLGYGDLACYGHPHIKTPNLDRMATEGIRFTDFYSAAPVCSPSRVGLLTGRSPNRAGVYDWIPPGGRERPNRRQDVHMRESEITIPQLLKKSGYATAMAGKWHCNSRFNVPAQPQPGDVGFDHWLGTHNNAAPSHANPSNYGRNGKAVGVMEGYSCQIVAEEGIGWMKNHRSANKDQPFFLYLAFHEPHELVASPEDITATYRDVAYSENEAEYFANVENVDRAVGSVLAYLKRADIDKETLVIFTSDNGPETLSRYGRASRSCGRADPLRGMKLWTTEAGFRVAGIMRWPGRIEGNQVSHQVVSALDFLPTFCDLADADIPADRALDGANFLPALEGGNIERDKPLVWAFYNALNEQQVAMRDGDWKVLARLDLPMIQNISGKNVGEVRAAELTDFEIYNLRHDIGEARNLAPSDPELRQRLVNKLNEQYSELLQDSYVWQ